MNTHKARSVGDSLAALIFSFKGFCEPLTMHDEQIIERVETLTGKGEPITSRDIILKIVDKLNWPENSEKFREAVRHVHQIIPVLLNERHYVLDDTAGAYVYIPPLPHEMSWFDGTQFGKRYYTRMPVKYIYDHPTKFAKKRLHDDSYIPERSHKIREALDSGVEPMRFQPVYISYHLLSNTIGFSGGIHRVKVFRERGIPHINASLELDLEFEAY